MATIYWKPNYRGRYTKGYPNELPTIWIKKIKGLSEAEIEELTKQVTAKVILN